MLPMRDCGVHGRPSSCSLWLEPLSVLLCRRISLEAFRSTTYIGGISGSCMWGSQKHQCATCFQGAAMTEQSVYWVGYSATNFSGSAAGSTNWITCSLPMPICSDGIVTMILAVASLKGPAVTRFANPPLTPKTAKNAFQRTRTDWSG
jgi:hypothetical protein